MAKLLGIDVGTSGCKVVLIDENGNLLRQASAEYPLSVPHPMWSEQDPNDWWLGVQQCLAEIGEREVDAIGLTGQMHGAVFLDASDQVVRPGILWNDQRTIDECREIDDTVGAGRVREITCNPPLTGFQLPKILWLRNHELSNFNRVRAILLPKDYIRLKLSGVKATEVSDASGTGLLSVPQRSWSPEIMAALELDPTLFPPVFESTVVSSSTTADGYLAEGIPIVGGGGDQAAGAVGVGAVEPGIVSASLGTSGVVFTSLDTPRFDPSGAAHTFCHANGRWHAMGVMLSCGGALRWLRDSVYLGESYERIAMEASGAPVGSNGTSFLPYLTGERCPYNDPYAQGAWAGLTLRSDRADLARSVFEGISFGLADCLDLLRTMGAQPTEVRVTGGGSRSPFWMQMLADVFEIRCIKMDSDEGPALGAAILAGVGIGLWADVAQACRATVRSSDAVGPGTTSYKAARANYTELYQALRPWQSVKTEK